MSVIQFRRLAHRPGAGDAKARHFMGLVSEQSLYNLDARMVELEVLPACKAYGLGVIPWSPLGGGLLGGVLEKIEKGRAPRRSKEKDVEEKRPQLEAWEASARTGRRNPPTWPWPGCCTTRLSPPRSSARARWTS